MCIIIRRILFLDLVSIGWVLLGADSSVRGVMCLKDEASKLHS